MSSRKQKQLEKIYNLILRLAHFVIFRIFRANIHGQIPDDLSRILVVSNHISFTDPPVLAAAIFRLTGRQDIHFFAKEELFSANRHFAQLIEILKAIPLKRAGLDIATIRKGLNVLKEGHILCIFPEGTRNKTNGLLKGKAGSGYIALKSNSPVLPVMMSNTNMGLLKMFFCPRSRINIQIGEIIQFSGKRSSSANARIVAEIMMKEIRGLDNE